MAQMMRERKIEGGRGKMDLRTLQFLYWRFYMSKAREANGQCYFGRPVLS